MADIKFAERVAIDFESKAKQKRRSAEERKASYEKTKERIINAINKDGGRYVTFPNSAEGESAAGLLICGVEFEKKLYFLYIDKDRQIRIMHHGESYRLIRELPNSLSVLNYVYNHQRNELRAAIEMFIESNDAYKLFTEIAIRPFRRDNDRNNKNDKRDDKKKKQQHKKRHWNNKKKNNANKLEKKES